MEKDPVINWISIISIFLCSFNSEIGLYLDAERALYLKFVRNGQ